MWDVDRPVKEIADGYVRGCVIELASIYHNDLNTHDSGTYLIPIPLHRANLPGEKRRIVAGAPHWYEELRRMYPNIRRDRTLRSLDRIAGSKDWPYGVFPFCIYDERYRALIIKNIAEGYYYMGYDIPADNRVRAYLGMPLVEEQFSQIEDPYNSFK